MHPKPDQSESRHDYRMPAEWESQSAIWFSWPHNVETWPENLDSAQEEFFKLVKSVAPTQPVYVMAGGAELSHATKRFQGIENVEIVGIETNDAWARDYAPTFVKSRAGELVAIDWFYNAWGGKYPPFDADQQVAKLVAAHLKIPVVSPEFCFEGGAIEVNDEGVLLCTKSCALDKNRNPNFSLEQAESILQQNLGASKIIWLSGDAIEGDDTDGHIDQLARFTDSKTIVYAWSEHENDPQVVGLKQNLHDLQLQIHEFGLTNVRLIPLPIPAPIEFCGRRVPASYCNFLITNELVLVPQFGVPEDTTAIEILTPLFPNRKIIGLPSKNLAVGLGSFHCLSQQQPATH